MTWAPPRAASCPAISSRTSFDRSSAMLTITAAYVIDLSCVTIDQSLLGSKSGKTTEIDQVAAPLIGEIIPQCWKNACEIPAPLADTAPFHLSARRAFE